MPKITLVGNENVKNSIIAIGQALIERAEEVSNNLKYVNSITIYANLTPTEITNFDITKNFTAFFNEEESTK